MSILRLRVLGPFMVARDGEAITIGRARECQLLCVLLMSAGQTVSNDRLVEERLGDDPPAKPHGALHTSISRNT